MYRPLKGVDTGSPAPVKTATLHGEAQGVTSLSTFQLCRRASPRSDDRLEHLEYTQSMDESMLTG